MIHFWVAVLAISTLLYVLLDGFDLGVGMIFGATPDEAKRDAMMSAVAPVWDGNETWLVVTGVVLWGAFPLAYSIIMSVFYLPLLVMLAGLILCGVAFEYRRKSERTRRLWDASFAGGSFVAAFIQASPSALWWKGFRSPMAVMWGANSAGSAPSRCFVASACALVMRCSARAGLSGNARARFEKVHIVSSLTYPSDCSSS